MTSLLFAVLFFAKLEAGTACVRGGGTGPLDLVQKIIDMTQISPYPSIDQGPAQSPSELTCNFDTDPFCIWRNVINDQFDWELGRFIGPIDPTIFRAVTGKNEQPVGNFVFARWAAGRRATDTAILAASLACQTGPAILSFDFCTTSEMPRVQVCVVPQDLSSRKMCFETVDQLSQNPVMVNIPAQTGPFQIQIEASGLSVPSVVVIDNLSYDLSPGSDICAGLTSAGSGGTTTGPGLFDCALLECNFNSLTPCGYDGQSPLSDFNAGQWNVFSGILGNIALGPRGDSPSDTSQGAGGYAVIGMEGRAENRTRRGNAILESPSFSLPRAATLQFDVFKKAATPEIMVCIDSLTNCPFTGSSIRPSLEGWNPDQSVPLPQGGPSHKVLFVASNLKNSEYIAVDRIRIQGLNSNECNVFTSLFKS